MRLNVLEKPETTAPPWYAAGLQFTCTQCGNCCTGGPGFVWISDEEIGRLAKHLGETEESVRDHYCRRVNGRWALLELRNSRGQYDCIFLRETPAPKAKGDKAVVHSRRTCAVYAARPLQCRTWPFWKENLASQNVWNKSAVHCHGMNRGKTWTPRQIEALANATDWPGKAPGS